MDASFLDSSAKGLPGGGFRGGKASFQAIRLVPLLSCRAGGAVPFSRCDLLSFCHCDKRLQESLFVPCSASLLFGVCCQTMLLFASQTAQGGPTVILPALLITGLLVAASQAFVPKGDDQN